MFWLKKIILNRILQHITFWSVSFYILLRSFATSSNHTQIDLIYTIIFTFFILIAVYINLLILIPRFFQQGRYFIYASFLVILLASITLSYMKGFDVIVDFAFDGYYLISYFDFWETAKYFVIFLGITSLLHFSKSWFLYKESETKLAKTQKEKLEAELDALKNQINPHFLFNSLNSIYSLVLKKNDQAPEALIKLSDTMRYIIYESNHDKVPLGLEIEFINNYIELQKLRMSSKDTLDFNITGEITDQKIAPLLMIPIIENCFKYGIKGDTQSSFVSIELDIRENMLSLLTINNIGVIDHVEKNKARGTGLANLKKRLALIYDNQHRLTIDKTDDKFIVNLKIDL